MRFRAAGQLPSSMEYTQLKEQRDHDERIRQEFEAKMEAGKAEKAELEAKIEKLREEAVEARVQAAVEEARPKLPHESISEEQLAALQARLQALHDAQLLTDEERDAIEDTVQRGRHRGDGDGGSLGAGA